MAEIAFGGRVPRSRFEHSGQRGQSITEFAMLAPLVFLMLALIFTGSQYLNAVVGMNGAARAGAIVASNARTGANSGLSQSAVNTAATQAVNREQGCTSCFIAVANQAACPAGASCVWTEQLQAPSGNPVEMVHVSVTVSSYLVFISNLVVAAKAGAES